MATAKFNIENSFKEVFGLYAKIPGYVVRRNNQESSLPEYPTAQDHTLEGEYEGGSLYSAPSGIQVWDRVSVTVPTNDGIAEYRLPHEIVITLSRAKNIVKTSLQGKDGTVKEYISMDDWDIRIRGFIIDYDNDLFPESQVRRLNEVFEKNRSLVINSKQLSLVGIEKIVVTDLRLPPMAGFQNVQPFEIDLLSDEPITLEFASV